MLVLSRRTGEKILIGNDVVVTVIKVKDGNTVSIGIDAPRSVSVDREEIAKRKTQQTQAGETS